MFIYSLCINLLICLPAWMTLYYVKKFESNKDDHLPLSGWSLVNLKGKFACCVCN